VAYLINLRCVSYNRPAGPVAAVNLVYSRRHPPDRPACHALPIFADEAQIVIEDILNLANQLRQTLSSPSVWAGCLPFGGICQGIFDAQNAVLSRFRAGAAMLETTSVGVLWFLVILVSVHLFLSKWPVMRDWLINLARLLMS